MAATLGRLPRFIKSFNERLENSNAWILQWLGPWPEPEPTRARAPQDLDLEWLQKHSSGNALHIRAAIALKIPNTGMAWLDEMIKQSRQLDIEDAKSAKGDAA